MESFVKLKKKSIISAIIASVIVGVFSALFAVGVVMLSVKLSANRLDWFYYLIIGIGGFIISGGICFIIIKPTDKSVAKRLDDEYGLKERTQTMLEFKEQDSAMLRLQRLDTEERLKNLPQKKFSQALVKSVFLKIWQYLAVGVVGVSLFLAGVIVPSRYTPSYDDNFIYNDWDASTLQQLIQDIKNSRTEDKVKIPVVESLTLLDEALKETTSKSEMRQKVKACASTIDGAVILANTYRVVAEAINQYTSLKDFKFALISASDSYKNELRITSIVEVESRASNSESLIRGILNNYINTFEGSFATATEVVTIREKVLEFLNPFNESLSEEKLIENKLIDKLNNTDFYQVLSTYSTELGNKNLLYSYQSTTISYAKEIVKTADSNYVSSASRLLSTQVYNRMIDEFALNTLSDLFGVSVYPEDLNLPGISDGDSSSDSSSQGGSVGDEDVIYGGDDAIFDPDSNTHVQYGKVWNTYMARLYERLNDPDYELSDEMKNYIKQYIKALTGDSVEE